MNISKVFFAYCRNPVNGSGVLDPYNSDISIVHGHHRYKRGFWEGIEFKLSVPSVDWQKKVGTKALGASFGVILENYLDLKIGKLIILRNKICLI